jgi:hypothetical protein
MKRLILGLVLVALSALAIPGSASAAPTYTTFVGCDDTAENPEPSHECLTTDHMAAYFEASEETSYEVCLFQNVIEEIDCSSATEAEAETLYENRFTIAKAGDYEVVWFEFGTEVELGEWALSVKSPPPPPPPPPPSALPALPVPPVVLPALPTVSPACLAAQKRVKKLKAKIRRAHGLQKAKLRGQLKKARAAVRAACLAQ